MRAATQLLIDPYRNRHDRYGLTRRHPGHVEQPEVDRTGQPLGTRVKMLGHIRPPDH